MRRTSTAPIHMVMWVSKALHGSVDEGTTPRPISFQTLRVIIENNVREKSNATDKRVPHPHGDVAKFHTAVWMGALEL